MKNQVIAVLEQVSRGENIKDTSIAKDVLSELQANCIALGRKLMPYEAQAIARKVMDWYDLQTAEFEPMRQRVAKLEANFLAACHVNRDIAYAFEHPGRV